MINYTNAAFIVKEGFKLPEDGLYSGFDAATQTYDKSTWNYEAGGDMTGKADTGGHATSRRQPVPRLRRRCRRIRPTTSRCSIRAAFSNC